MSSISHTTKLLMSAAHLYPDDFKDDIKERLQHPYKSPAPELGIDLDEIQKELENAKGSHFLKSSFLLIVSAISLLVVFQDPEETWGILFLALILASIAELAYSRSAKHKVRKLMGGLDAQADSERAPGRGLSQNNVIISGGFNGRPSFA